MRYINNRPSQCNMTMFYSTPSTYVRSVNKLNLVWLIIFHVYGVRIIYEQDFMQLVHWKRVTIEHVKNIIVLQDKSISWDINPIGTTQVNNLTNLWSAIGVHQHHDAMPGTDYESSTRIY